MPRRASILGAVLCAAVFVAACGEKSSTGNGSLTSTQPKPSGPYLNPEAVASNIKQAEEESAKGNFKRVDVSCVKTGPRTDVCEQVREDKEGEKHQTSAHITVNEAGTDFVITNQE